jgi:hypothetical protein
LGTVLKQILTSKKALAAILGVVVGLAAKLGLALDTETLMAILSPILAYILGQGLADTGKEAVKAKEAA